MKKLIPFLLACLLFSCQTMEEIGVLVPPTVDQDPALPSVSVSVAGQNRLIHVRTFGNTDNPPLFILHGSYSDSRPYRNICESLSDKYHVVFGTNVDVGSQNALRKTSLRLRAPWKRSTR